MLVTSLRSHDGGTNASSGPKIGVGKKLEASELRNVSSNNPDFDSPRIDRSDKSRAWTRAAFLASRWAMSRLCAVFLGDHCNS